MLIQWDTGVTEKDQWVMVYKLYVEAGWQGQLSDHFGRIGYDLSEVRSRPSIRVLREPPCPSSDLNTRTSSPSPRQ